MEGWCEARAAGAEGELPRARRRPARRALTVACAVVEAEGRVLLARREPGGGLFAGLLGFPAAEVPPGGDARAALAAGLAGAGLRVRVGVDLGAVERMLTHRHITLRAFACSLAGKAKPGAHLRWIPAEALAEAGLPSAMRALVPLVTAGRAAPDVRRRGAPPAAAPRRNSARILSRSRSD